MLGADARARPLLSEGGSLVSLPGSARGRVPYGPPSPTVRASGTSTGPVQPPLVPDGSVCRDAGRDPGTEQSHAHGEHFLGEHVAQQRDLASQLEVADGRTGRACHVADEGTGQAVRVDVFPVLDASSRAERGPEPSEAWWAARRVARGLQGQPAPPRAGFPSELRKLSLSFPSGVG